MILLDYIANKGVRLPREGSSTRTLWARVRAAAGRVGVGAVFPPTDQVTIIDDHTPFLRAGIPAVDLIDFSYRYADSLQDTIDKLSVAQPGRGGGDGVRAGRRAARGLGGDGRGGVSVRCEHGRERLHHRRVELRAGAAAQLGERLCGAARARYGRSETMAS